MFDRDAMRTVLVVEQPYANHNGGDLVFGPDGMLYIGMGDGGSGGDPERRALNLGQLLGKMLRIDPTPSGDRPYTVPPDNPFVDTPGARPEIWSVGLRNPWRFSFDRQTGDLWIADVGQNAIGGDRRRAGDRRRRRRRGPELRMERLRGQRPLQRRRRPPTAPLPPDLRRTATTGRLLGQWRRAVPRRRRCRALVGWYVFGDYCSGEVCALQIAGKPTTRRRGDAVEIATTRQITAVVSGPNGELYVLSVDNDRVFAVGAASD